MSYTVYCDDEYLWGPALEVGNYFIGSVQMLEKMLKADSGVTSLIADTIEIDKTKLRKFVELSLNKIETTNNTPFFAMISGTVEILLALDAKVNSNPPQGRSQSVKLVNRSKKIFTYLEEYLHST
jgi:hypothetical protein